jgi:hypothetical protein
MRPYGKLIAAAAIILAGVAAFAPAPDASDAHFVIVNDNDISGDNFGAVLKLSGTKKNPVLNQVASLSTHQPSEGDGPYPQVQVVRSATNICIFLASSESKGNAVTSWKYPGPVYVGNYTDGNVQDSLAEGTGIVVADGYVFAFYNGYMSASYIAPWQIGPGCTLTLLGTYDIPYPVFNMAATPSGNALVVSYDVNYEVDSFAIGGNGALTERGPYEEFNAEAAWGLDITADSKVAIFDMQGFGPPYDDNETEINTFAINADGSLGVQGNFGADGSLGSAHSGGWVRLSPDQRFLFVSSETNVTTLNFTEIPLSMSYSGCLTDLRVPNGEPTLNAGTMATVGMAGAGTGIYVAETFDLSTIALLSVNPNTGCTSEVTSSPFPLSDPNAALWSLVAWPPRPF